MQNRAGKWLTEYMSLNYIATEEIAKRLSIPLTKLEVGSKEVLDADEFLRLCLYLHIRPENIPIEFQDKKYGSQNSSESITRQSGS